VRTEESALRLDGLVKVGRCIVVQLGQHHVTQADVDLTATPRSDLGQQAERGR
jgi:hypothetical protein